MFVLQSVHLITSQCVCVRARRACAVGGNRAVCIIFPPLHGSQGDALKIIFISNASDKANDNRTSSNRSAEILITLAAHQPERLGRIRSQLRRFEYGVGERIH